MRIRLDDVPPGPLREQIIRQLADDEQRRARRATTPPDRPESPQTSPSAPPCSLYLCAGAHGCGAQSSNLTEAQRHADTHGGARIECVIGGLA